MALADELGAAVLGSAGDAVIAADAAGVILFWNPGAERIFGFTAAEAIGQSLDLIIPEALRQRHWQAYHQVMRTGQSRLRTRRPPGRSRRAQRWEADFVGVHHHATTHRGWKLERNGCDPARRHCPLRGTAKPEAACRRQHQLGERTVCHTEQERRVGAAP